MKTLKVLLLGMLAVASGCTDSDDGATGGPASSNCEAGALCDVKGVPFVHAIVPATDAWTIGDPPAPAGGTTAKVRQPASGKVCMAGHVEAGYAFLTLGFATVVHGHVEGPLDADALGITSMEFSLESPPPEGLKVQLLSLVPDCTGGVLDCQHWGFYLSSDPERGVLASYSEPGVVRAPFDAFVVTDSAEPGWTLDTTHLSAVQVGIGAYGPATADYDFCVSGFAMKNAAGEAVTPAS